ncbi:hypothetical protein [Marisediminicola senii]|uniref:hypothetical protein n=1 Tax=Marisediminicola senii TaxID=2711233 RepID=UPI0013EA2A76|nr:hypothetical protein [Marisediminicola senii]
MPRLQPDDPGYRHGTTTGYTYGCRCRLCKDAINAYQRERKRLKTRAERTAAAAETALPAQVNLTPEPKPRPAPAPRPAAPIVLVAARAASRRLQALTWMGYTPHELAQHTNFNVDAIWWLLIDPPAGIQYRTDQTITDVFNRLKLQPRSPAGGTPLARGHHRARALAEHHNWIGPFSWDDIDGDPTPPPAHGPKASTVARLQHRIDHLEQLLTEAHTTAEEA